MDSTFDPCLHDQHISSVPGHHRWYGHQSVVSVRLGRTIFVPPHLRHFHFTLGPRKVSPSSRNVQRSAQSGGRSIRDIVQYQDCQASLFIGEQSQLACFQHLNEIPHLVLASLISSVTPQSLAENFGQPPIACHGSQFTNRLNNVLYDSFTKCSDVLRDSSAMRKQDARPPPSIFP
jgi:hypothetical protein